MQHGAVDAAGDGEGGNVGIVLQRDACAEGVLLIEKDGAVLRAFLPEGFAVLECVPG